MSEQAALSATASNGHISSLDGWRGLAIICVLIGHFFTVPGIQLGALGVELFFVLSGRLMAEILFERKLDLPTFIYRRSTRLIPALSAFVIIMFVALSVLTPESAPSPLWIPLSLSFLVNYAYVFGYVSGWFDHVWSLCIEAHAYILLALIAFVFGRSRGKAMAIIWLVAILAMANGLVSMALFDPGANTTYFRSDVRIASIFLPAAMYLSLRTSPVRGFLCRNPLPALCVSSAVGLLAFSNLLPAPIHFTVSTCAFSIAVCLVDLAGARTQRAFSNPVLVHAGLWSYSIYLWQQPFYKLSEIIAVHPAILLVVGVACGVASYYLIERPARRWLNLLGRHSAPAAANP